MLSTQQKIILARLLCRIVLGVRYLAGLPANAKVRRRGISWSLDLKEGIDLAIFLFGAFEKKTVRAYSRLIKQGDIVLDVGANIGAHTLHIAKLVGDTGHVYAFEPTTYAYRKLTENISLNPELKPRITLVQGMLKDGINNQLEAEIYSSWPLEKESEVHAIHSGRLESTAGAIVTSVDAFLKKRGIREVNFVKMDVDGNEVSVLKGARKLLQRSHCPILMELSFYTLKEANTSVGELLEILKMAEYQFYDERSGRPLPMHTEELRMLVPPAGSRNVLAKVVPGVA